MASHIVIAYEEPTFPGQKPSELCRRPYNSPVPVPAVGETATVHGIDETVTIVVKRRIFHYTEIEVIVCLYGEPVD